MGVGRAAGEKVTGACQVVAPTLELAKLALIDDVVITIGQPVTLKTQGDIFMGDNCRRRRVCHEGASAAHVINMTVGENQ